MRTGAERGRSDLGGAARFAAAESVCVFLTPLPAVLAGSVVQRAAANESVVRISMWVGACRDLWMYVCMYERVYFYAVCVCAYCVYVHISCVWMYVCISVLRIYVLCLHVYMFLLECVDVLGHRRTRSSCIPSLIPHSIPTYSSGALHTRTRAYSRQFVLTPGHTPR